MFGAAALATDRFADAAEKIDKPPAPTGEVKTGGSRMIPIDGGKFHVWTKKIGNGRIKMLTLHGRPEFTHEYFECFEDFLPQEGVELYYYDQFGSFYSDQPTVRPAQSSDHSARQPSLTQTHNRLRTLRHGLNRVIDLVKDIHIFPLQVIRQRSVVG